MNSLATSVARWRTHRSEIVAWLLFSRKNRSKPFLEFCNTIPLITDIVAWASRSLAGDPSNRPCFSSDETRGAHSHFPFVPVGPRLSLLAAAVALQPQAVAAESASQQVAALALQPQAVAAESASQQAAVALQPQAVAAESASQQAA